MIDLETPVAFGDRDVIGSIFTDIFKASPVAVLQRKVGQQIAQKATAQGATPAQAQAIQQGFNSMTPTVGDLAKGLAKTTAIAAPALIAIAAPVAVPALASALGYAAPTAAETGLAGIAASGAALKPAVSILQGARSGLDTSGIPSVSSASGALRAGSAAATTIRRAGSLPSSTTVAKNSPASTSNRDALANLLVGVARQVEPQQKQIVINPAAGTKDLLPNILATVAHDALPGAPPLPATVTNQVKLVPIPLPQLPRVGRINQTSFAPVPLPSTVRVQRSTPSPSAPKIDTKGITPVVNWTVTNAGQVTRGASVIAGVLPQWLVYSSGHVVRIG